MANITAVILSAKALKGGGHKIRISVSHNGGTKYILTDITVDSSSQFANGAVRCRPDANYLNVRLRKQLQMWQEALDKVEYTAGLSVSELVEAMKSRLNADNCTLQSVYSEYVGMCVESEGTKKVYATAYNCISRILPPSTKMKALTPMSAIKLKKGMADMGLSPSTVKVRLVFFSTLVNYAKKCGYATLENALSAVKMPEQTARNSWLTVEQIRTIRDAELPRKSMRKARDFFMLSYCLGGMNIEDILRIDAKSIGDEYSYMRTKTIRTHYQVTIPIFGEAKEMLARVTKADGSFAITDSQMRNRGKSLLDYNLKLIAEQLGIPNLIFYSARKSFAQHAYELGVQTEVIDYLLGHSARKGQSIYSYVKVKKEMAAKSLRKVLDNLK